MKVLFDNLNCGGSLNTKLNLGGYILVIPLLKTSNLNHIWAVENIPICFTLNSTSSVVILSGISHVK